MANRKAKGMIEDKPLVSVVTPSYNSGEFIEDTLLSVKNQDYPNIEHIIVDGGSKDNTLDILKKYEGTYNMCWLSEPDKGEADAVNKGFEMAKGEIIGWVNADDTYFDTKVFPHVVKAFKKFEADIIYGDFVFINSTNLIMQVGLVPDYSYEKLLRWGYIPQGPLFFRKEVVKNNKLDISFHYPLDYEFWLRLGKRYSFRHIHRLLFCGRYHEKMKSLAHEIRVWEDERSRLKEQYELGDISFSDTLTMRYLRIKGIVAYLKLYNKRDFATNLKLNNAPRAIFNHLTWDFHSVLEPSNDD